MEGDNMNNHIVLFNKGVLPTYLVVHFKPNDKEWDVREIEMYADQHLRTLICDAITIDQLPAQSRASLISALDRAREGTLVT
jgi:hypothetical protein